MLAATLKSTGMIAVPEAIRDLLKLEPGRTPVSLQAMDEAIRTF